MGDEIKAGEMGVELSTERWCTRMATASRLASWPQLSHPAPQCFHTIRNHSNWINGTLYGSNCSATSHSYLTKLPRECPSYNVTVELLSENAKRVFGQSPEIRKTWKPRLSLCFALYQDGFYQAIHEQQPQCSERNAPWFAPSVCDCFGRFDPRNADGTSANKSNIRSN